MTPLALALRNGALTVIGGFTLLWSIVGVFGVQGASETVAAPAPVSCTFLRETVDRGSVHLFMLCGERGIYAISPDDVAQYLALRTPGRHLRCMVTDSKYSGSCKAE